jgi:RNA polymerase-binding transcription factor DksA
MGPGARAALVCIEQGAYGPGVDRARPIPPARLAARPGALRCVAPRQAGPIRLDTRPHLAYCYGA